MFHRVQVLALACIGLALTACTTTPADEERHATGQTITGSNIPRREATPRTDVLTIDKDSVQEVMSPNSRRGKPGG